MKLVDVGQDSSPLHGRAAATIALTLLACAGAVRSAVPGLSAASNSSTNVRQQYLVTDLGVMPSIAANIVPGLSGSGNVVIWRQTDSGGYAPIFWDGLVQKVLLPPKGYRNSFAYSVNDHGEAVGWSNTTLNPVDSASTVHASLFRRNRSIDLGTLGGSSSKAYAINNNNIIVGVSELANRQQRAFRYAHGKMVALNPLPGGKYSVAFNVNNTGAIVGGSEVPGDSTKPLVHAVLWRGGTPLDLGALGNKESSIAYAINDHGDVVGVSGVRSQETVFLYSQGEMRDLGVRGQAFAINDQRQIVGSLDPEERHRPRGFIWDNGALHDLNSLLPNSRYSIEAAFRINNRGQILCRGYGDGHLRALLLNPIH
jgi:probable HAF family extracellular repeat protein